MSSSTRSTLAPKRSDYKTARSAKRACRSPAGPTVFVPVTTSLFALLSSAGISVRSATESAVTLSSAI